MPAGQTGAPMTYMLNGKQYMNAGRLARTSAGCNWRPGARFVGTSLRFMARLPLAVFNCLCQTAMYCF
jgi:hypothetical protein